jgi:hypothetical protein
MGLGGVSDTRGVAFSGTTLVAFMPPPDGHCLEVEKRLSESTPIELICTGCVASARSYQDALPAKLFECSDDATPRRAGFMTKPSNAAT